MRIPTWEELKEKQLDVLEYPLNQPLFVVGPPGSGKTILACHRARMAANHVTEQYGDHKPVGIVTYNRMLRRLLELLSGAPLPSISIWTMHQFTWRDFKEKAQIDPPTSSYNSYIFLWEKLLKRMQSVKSEIPKMRHIVVDEGQDLPAKFFRYIAKFSSDVLTVFADEEQALNNQRTSILQIKRAGFLNDPLILSENHRNSPEVARLAQHFHDGKLPVTNVLRAESGNLPRLVCKSDLRSKVRFVSNWYRTYGGIVGAIVSTNDFGKLLHKALQEKLPDTRIDLYDSNERNEDSINLLSSGITVLNKESAKGQEFDTVFVLQLEHFIPCSDAAARRAMYMMCARARDNLFLVCGQERLSPEAKASLPGADVLEQS